MVFTSNVSDISIAFAGIATPSSTRLFAIAADNTVVTSVAATSGGQTTLSLSGLTGVSKFVVTPGDFNDWVGFDNINYTTAAVPEPASMAILGIGALALVRRRRAKNN